MEYLFIHSFIHLTFIQSRRIVEGILSFSVMSKVQQKKDIKIETNINKTE